MGSSLHVFSTVSSSSEGGRKKMHLLPSSQIRGAAHSGSLSHFTFSPFVRQWQPYLSQNPLCGRLGKGQREYGKVPGCRGLGSPLERGDLWMGHAFHGCGLELGRGKEKSEGGGRQEEEGQPRLFKSSGTSLFCRRGNIWVSDNFHLNSFALALYISHTVPGCVYEEACHSGDGKRTETMPLGGGEWARNIPNSQGNVRSTPKHPRKNPGARLEQRLPKGKRDFPRGLAFSDLSSTSFLRLPHAHLIPWILIKSLFPTLTWKARAANVPRSPHKWTLPIPRSELYPETVRVTTFRQHLL